MTGQAGIAARMGRGQVFSPDCPSRTVLKRITSRWGVLVLVALLPGTRRFSDLGRRIGGISERMLAQTLDGLEEYGLVDRVSFPVVPPRVEYSLTPLGQEAAARVAAFVDWIEGNLPALLAGPEASVAASGPGALTAR